MYTKDLVARKDEDNFFIATSNILTNMEQNQNATLMTEPKFREAMYYAVDNFHELLVSIAKRLNKLEDYIQSKNL